jgi:hypothetical protein
MGERGWRLGTHLTGGPHLSVRGREEGERRRLCGPRGPIADWAGGVGLDWLLGFVFFSFSFPFLFKSIFKPISNLLNSNLFIFSN